VVDAHSGFDLFQWTKLLGAAPADLFPDIALNPASIIFRHLKHDLSSLRFKFPIDSEGAIPVNRSTLPYLSYSKPLSSYPYIWNIIFNLSSLNDR